MAKNLDELKAELYESFNTARAKNKEFSVYASTRYPEIAKASFMAMQAAAETARAIVQVEHEISERDERKNGLKLPGKA